MPRCRFLLSLQDRSRFFDLEEGQEALIGRSLDAGFFLNAPSISRQHCVLKATPAGLVVEDLSSRRECFVNGQRAEGPTPLEDGSLLEIGGLGFTVTTCE